MSRSPGHQLSQTARDRIGRTPAGGSTSSQLRDDIDSGRTGDKVAWPDPAVAPLGTDAEAAGTPPAAEAVTAARQREISRSAASPSDRQRPRAAWVLAALVLMIVGALIGWLVVQAV